MVTINLSKVELINSKIELAQIFNWFYLIINVLKPLILKF